jgi:hypothetical protein
MRTNGYQKPIDQGSAAAKARFGVPREKGYDLCPASLIAFRFSTWYVNSNSHGLSTERGLRICVVASEPALD